MDAIDLNKLASRVRTASGSDRIMISTTNKPERSDWALSKLSV
jgi:hypothetical protein